MRDSRARYALVLICIVLVALRFEPLHWVIPALGFILVLLGTYEWNHMARLKGIEFSEAMAHVGAAALYLAALSPSDIFPWLVMVLLPALVMATFAAHMARAGVHGSVTGVPAALLPALYLGLGLACGLQVLQVDRMFFVFALVCVWAMDSAAFYIGCAYGRHKMAPLVSPKKSWEGAAAALGAAVATALLARWLFDLDLSWTQAATLGLLFGTLGQVGDLAESALKRDVGIKDSGVAFGGHGGILDRVDSLLFCFLTFYVWLHLNGFLERSSAVSLAMGVSR